MKIHGKAVLEISCSVIISLASIASATAGSIDPNSTVTIGIGNEPPYTELKPDGTLSGAGPDIDRAALAQAGVSKYAGQSMVYGAMIPALQAGRLSMVSSGGLVITPERCKQVIFSEPVICNTEAFLVREEDATKFKTYKEAGILKIKVAVAGGSVQEKNALAGGVLRENIVTFPDGTSAVKMLQDKRVDAVALNDNGVTELQKRSGDPSLKIIFPITDAPIGCGAAAFNKKDTELRDAYNKGLKKLIADGEYTKIMLKYGLDNNEKLRASVPTTEEQCNHAVTANN
nr:ectoine/hydroxyectoine ABC transporter substrate-binding protein EhuB [uncultured Pseudomonas sp.]